MSNNIYSIKTDDKSIMFFRNSNGRVWIEIQDGYQSHGIQLELHEAEAVGSILKGLSVQPDPIK